MEDFRSAAHAPAVSAHVGLWLGVAFTLCFLTGLASHVIQHPTGWFSWPTRPVSLYRITQGVHVLSGIAAIPLLLAKVWSVYPRLFTRPPQLRRPGALLGHAAERVAILVLLAAAFFQLVTGVLNVAQAYPWRFSFPAAHYAVAWVAFGALIVHIGGRLPLIRDTLRHPTPACRTATTSPASPSGSACSGPRSCSARPAPGAAANGLRRRTCPPAPDAAANGLRRRTGPPAPDAPQPPPPPHRSTRP
jgi:hypothetical protein